MGRQLFLHHYLPAHVASCLVTGALLEFICNAEPSAEEVVTYQAVKSGKKSAPGVKHHVTARERYAGQSQLASWIVMTAILLLAVAGWYFFLPLTYGYPGLTVEEVLQRKWLGYDLHFAK